MDKTQLFFFRLHVSVLWMFHPHPPTHCLYVWIINSTKTPPTLVFNTPSSIPIQRRNALPYLSLCLFLICLFFWISNVQIETDFNIPFYLQPSLCHNMVSRCKLHVWRTETCLYIVHRLFNFSILKLTNTWNVKSVLDFLLSVQRDRLRHLEKLWPSVNHNFHLLFSIFFWQRWGGVILLPIFCRFTGEPLSCLSYQS